MSSHLLLFKWTAKDVANFRCPYCGDSKKKHSKHGYLFETNDGYMYKCHKCTAALPFNAFLKQQNNVLYRDYLLEKYTSNQKNPEPLKQKKKYVDFAEVPHLVKVSELPKNHEGYKYLANRKIPEEFYNILYYTENYKKWVNENVDEDAFEKIPKEDKRIVIPFFSSKEKIFAFQGRSLNKNDPQRYITTKKSPKILIYGLERIDFNKTMYLTEAPFDSLFIENCIAAAGSSLAKTLSFDMDIVYIFDNEPRAKIIVDLMEKIIKSGKKIVIWPRKVKEKDINEMVENGLDAQKIVWDNTYQGLNAMLKFNDWKRT